MSYETKLFWLLLLGWLIPAVIGGLAATVAHH